MSERCASYRTWHARNDTEPCAQLEPGGTRNMTVACDEGAGAQAGALLETGDVPPNRAPGNTHRGLSFASHGPCSSLLLI